MTTGQRRSDTTADLTGHKSETARRNRNGLSGSVVVTGMQSRPFLRYAGIYVAVELAALALLIWAAGLGWALVVLAATFLGGVLLAASQVKSQVAAVRRSRRNPQGAVADSVLVGLGLFLVFLPGIVSTAAGALMLAPPTRGAMRPLAATMLTRGVTRRIGASGFPGGFTGGFPGAFTPNFTTAGVGRPGRGDYIDGEVIGEVVEELPVRR